MRRYHAQNLAAHDVTSDMVDESLADPFVVDEDLESNDGNFRVMFVGKTQSERLLEIGIEYRDDDIDFVFHGMSATPYYAALYERQGK
ncbi:MAG: hypothetical protein IT342_05195 [Candidatus Melainabacteria bacterium]|nr:hypothetical protein [Candidatus Melainabacteria bacterium]